MPPPNFHCALCGKSYARATELEAHENSYDHQHKKRLKEMKAMTRNPLANLSGGGVLGGGGGGGGGNRKRDEGSAEMKSVAVPEREARRLDGQGKAGRRGRGAEGGGGGGKGSSVIGFGAAVKGVEVGGKGQGEGGVVEGKEVVVEDGLVRHSGPVRWENLGRLGEVVDLEPMRPKELQRFVAARDRHMERRKDSNFYDEVRRRVGARRG